LDAAKSEVYKFSQAIDLLVYFPKKEMHIKISCLVGVFPFSTVLTLKQPNKTTMKTSLHFLFASICLLASNMLLAQVPVRTSIANGNWNNPATWSPAGVPQLGDDTIIVNTDVTFGQLIAHGNSLFQVNTGASLIGTGNDSIVFGGDKMINNGYISTTFMGVGANDSAVNRGVLVVTTEFSMSSLFVNVTSGQICIGQSCITSDQFINNGSLSCNDFFNSAAFSGSGRVCVANIYVNSVSISGTLDICDATPNTQFDINAGTIAGTVTNCQAGPCTPCLQPNAVADLENAYEIALYPNPFSNQTQITIDPKLASLDGLVFVVVDMQGRTVRHVPVTSATIDLERGDLAAGLFLYRLTANGQVYASGKMIVE
jgi:hypothetical protein